MRHGSVFTATGMLDFGLMLAGLDEPAWVCESDEWRRERILAQRFPGAVRYDDVRAVGRGCGAVDLLAGGFPCKGASTAGLRNGFDHAETVLWREMARAIGELRPRYVLVENVANILAIHDGAVWGEVLGDLATLGYDTVWDCIPAAAVGAPHLRDRVFAVATHTDGMERAEVQPLDRQPGPVDGPGEIKRASRPHRAPGVASDADGDGLRQQPVAEQGRRGAALTACPGEAVADAGQGRREGQSAVDISEPTIAAGHARRLGVPVEWGGYEPCIRRWEQVVGTAPEPLCAFRGVDARAAARVERSRLSALGDGVQIQVGQLVGAYILELEQQRTELMAA